MINTKSTLLSDVLNRKITARPAVWLMRQAGRYLREYLELREKFSFIEICSNYELALQATLQPIQAFDVDAAIIFSDILFPLRDLGIVVDFDPGPKILTQIKHADDVRNFLKSDYSNTCVMTMSNIVRQTRNSLPDKSIIGFAGSPWTLLCYLICQEGYKSFEGAKVFAKSQPKACEDLMCKLTDFVENCLLAQFQAGAHAVQIFDSWGGILSNEDYKIFSLPWIQKIIDTLHKASCPTILYTRDSSHLLARLSNSGACCLSLDWRVSAIEAKHKLDPKIVIQGNLDPTDLFTNIEEIERKTKGMITSWSSNFNYIANLGHGVLPQTPRSAVAKFVKTVKDFRFDTMHKN